MTTDDAKRRGYQFEADVEAKLRSAGVAVYKNGWPDLLLLNPNEKNWTGALSSGCALELKTGCGTPSRDQTLMHEALWSLGVPTYVVREDFYWDIDRGWSPVVGELRGMLNQ